MEYFHALPLNKSSLTSVSITMCQLSNILQLMILQALVIPAFQMQLGCCIRRHYGTRGRRYIDSPQRMLKIPTCILLQEQVRSLRSNYMSKKLHLLPQQCC